MKASKIIKITLVSLLVAALTAYIVYAMVFLSAPQADERCVAVELSVQKNPQAKFIDEKDIEFILKNARLYPKGMLMKDVNTKKIEETIRKNDYVANVECYKTSNGKLHIDIEQRIPVIFVMPNGREGYFVDAKGKIIPNSSYAVNLITASGSIDEAFASSKLAEFGQFIQTDAFWNNQIEQLYVTKDKKGRHTVEIVPRVGEHIIYLGTMDDYQHKLHKLRTFYEKAMGTVGWNKYARINLEYGNQIICTKK